MKQIPLLLICLLSVFGMQAQIKFDASAGFLFDKQSEIDPSFGVSFGASIPVTSNTYAGVSFGRYSTSERIPELGIKLAVVTAPILAFGEYHHDLKPNIASSIGLGVGLMRREVFGLAAGYFCIAPKASLRYAISNKLRAVGRYEPSLIVHGELGSALQHTASVGICYDLDL